VESVLFALCLAWMLTTVNTMIAVGVVALAMYFEKKKRNKR